MRVLFSQPMVRRIVASTGSNAYAQATTIAMQMLSLPLFLSIWDVATYGQWLVLSAVPSYLLMADVGMVTAAGNRMTMLVGEGNRGQANQVFQSALAFVLTVCTAALLLVLLAVRLWPAGPATASDEGRIALALLAAGVIAALVGGLPEAIYRATQRYAFGAAVANTVRLLEWAGGLTGLWWGGGFVDVALGALVARTACTAAMIVHAARTTPDFRWSFETASLAEVRRCAAPALSFMVFPAANALNFQGMTLVAASVLGPAATVVFNTYRTLARVTVQATGVFSNAVWPEFSRLYGRGDLASLATLYQRSRWIGAVLAATASAVVYLIAPSVLRVWSKGQIAFTSDLMFVAMVYAAASGGWHVSRVLLLSTNEHSALAWPYLAASAACLPVAWLLARPFGAVGIMFSMLGLEVAMLLLCAWLARRLLAPPPMPSKPSDVAAS